MIIYRGLEVTFNYGEGCWNHCNKMYRGLPNLNHVQGVKMSGNFAHRGCMLSSSDESDGELV